MTTRFLLFAAIAIGSVNMLRGAQELRIATPAADGKATSPLDNGNTAEVAFRTVQQYREDISRIKHTGSNEADTQVAYERMVENMTVPVQLSHLEFPAEDPNREWTVSATRVANGIKPKINYQVVNGDTAVSFQGTPSVQKNLHDNVRLIAWYRAQMEQVCPDEKAAKGTYALGRVIDAFLDRFAESIPPVQVRMDGTINQPSDQRIEYSHREIWEMLAAVNRYFFYKVQIHDEEAREFCSADLLLMCSMIRIAGMYGAAPPSQGLSKIETRLEKESTEWRGDAFTALNSWAEAQKKSQQNLQQLCKITIPSPKTAPTPAATTPSFPADVEDVKELGGKIFIKRKGFWSLWEK